MRILHCIIASLIFSLVACTPNINSDHYIVENVGQSQQVLYGKIVKSRVVQVSSRNEQTGTLAGTGAGAAAGSMIGNTTSTNVLGAIGGAVLGGVVGNQIGSRAGTQKGMEYIVNLNGGKTISIVQGMEPLLKIGQFVMLLTGGNTKDRLVAA